MKPYSSMPQSELSLRDQLALDRTLLAVERTGLAYLRSALTLFIAGFTFMQLFPGESLEKLGMACIPTSVCVAFVGIRRWRRALRELSSLRRQPSP